jgi:arabinofuranosyltransferase
VAAWSLVPRLRSRSRIDVKSIVIATLLAHLGYYTFIIGGDHFEYRVYSHLTLLLPVAFVWLLGARPLRPRAAILLMSTAWLLSLPVPWTHWGLARNLTTREATIQMRVEVAPHWPVPFRFYAEGFDRLQDWLIRHMVCVRHQEHSVFWRESIKLYPSREEGARISSEEFPIHADFAVGVPGWTLPHVYILDLWGLNDRVVARSRLPAKGARYMAHERVAPRDYLDCLRPNVVLSPEGRWVVRPRQRVLTAADIRRCENR